LAVNLEQICAAVNSGSGNVLTALHSKL
jgi:hypothetical protein